MRKAAALLILCLCSIGCEQLTPSAPSAISGETLGTWVPVFGGSVSTSGQDYASQHGEYRRDGSLVFVSATITLRRKGTIVGHLEVQGLPFPSAPHHNSSCAFGDFDGTATKHTWIGGIINSGVSVVWLRTRQDLVMSLMSTEDITDTTAFQMQCTYLTDAK